LTIFIPPHPPHFVRPYDLHDAPSMGCGVVCFGLRVFLGPVVCFVLVWCQIFPGQVPLTASREGCLPVLPYAVGQRIASMFCGRSVSVHGFLTISTNPLRAFALSRANPRTLLQYFSNFPRVRAISLFPFSARLVEQLGVYLDKSFFFFFQLSSKISMYNHPSFSFLVSPKYPYEGLRL